MYTPVSFIEGIPGFSVFVPSKGHLHITSAFWVGKLIYYPSTGKIDTQSVTIPTDLQGRLDDLKNLSELGQVTTMSILMLGYDSGSLLVILQESMRNSI